MKLFQFAKKKSQSTVTKAPIVHHFIDPNEYVQRYLICEMQTISSSNITPTTAYYETFAAFAGVMLENNSHPGAINELGERYLFGLEGITDVDKALELFEKAAQLGHPDAMTNRAEVYRVPQFGRQDFKKYFEMVEIAAERGSWSAMFNLACAYAKGKEAYGGAGYEIDMAKSLDWAIAAANMSCDILIIFQKNTFSKRFMPYLQRVHEVCVRAIHMAVTQMLEGDGVPVNKEGARVLLEKSIPMLEQLEGEKPKIFVELLNKCK